MSTTDKPWIALAATHDLPIARAPVDRMTKNIAEVREIPVPYKPLSEKEIIFWAQQLEGAKGILLRSGYITAQFLRYLPDVKIVKLSSISYSSGKYSSTGSLPPVPFKIA